jgi:hypothetical protein
MKVLAVLNSQGVVHNWMNANCPVIKRVHEVEFRGGREIHRVITAKQALVYGLPGCEACWGNHVAYRNMLEVQ